MNYNLLNQASGFSQDYDYERGQEPVREFDSQQNFTMAEEAFEEKKKDLEEKKDKIIGRLGEAKTQAIEASVPAIVKGGRALGERTGASEALGRLGERAMGAVQPAREAITELGGRIAEGVRGIPQAVRGRVTQAREGFGGVRDRDQLGEDDPDVMGGQRDFLAGARDPRLGGFTQPGGSIIAQVTEQRQPQENQRAQPVPAQPVPREEQEEQVRQRETVEQRPAQAVEETVGSEATLAERAKGALGGFGAETLAGTAIVGELADPNLKFKQKAKAVGETAGAYGATKLGGKILEASGSSLGIGEVLTGVEAVQDLTDKDISPSKRIEKASGAVGTGLGAMGLESLVPGLGEAAMVATGVGELIHGFRKERREMTQEKQQQTQLDKQAPQQQPYQGPHTTIAFDNAPVLDSSDYHNL